MRRSIHAAVCALAFAAAACEHKELCYDHPHTVQVDVVFDWIDAPEATVGDGVGSMCLWFYPVDEAGNRAGDPVYQSLSGMDGGRVDIPFGRYQVLYYNNDYERVLFRGTDWFFTHECYTREGGLLETVYGKSSTYDAPRVEGTGDEPVRITPDRMWGGSAMDLEITEDGVSYWYVRDGETEATTVFNPDNTLRLMPHKQVCDYTYEIRHVENLQYVTRACAALTGMSGSVFCAEETLGDERVTLPLEAVSDGQSAITGKFCTFGHDEQNAERHYLTVYVWCGDGSTYWYANDVTDQVDGAADKRNVHIVVDSLKLPKPIVNGGGFQPDVEEWETVDVPVTM